MNYPNPNINLASGVLAYYQRDNIDGSPNGLNLTASSNVNYTTGADGLTDSAGLLDSTNNYAFNGDTDHPLGQIIQENSNYSLSVFLKTDDSGVESSVVYICGQLFGSSNDDFVAIHLERMLNNNANRLDVYAASNHISLARLDATNNPWIHVVLTKDNDSIKVYVDAKLLAEVRSVSFSEALTSFVLFSSASVTHPTPFQHVIVYDRALTNAEVVALNNNGSGRSPY